MAKIEKLLEGYKRFRADHFDGNKTLYEKLYKEGQSPKTLVIACSDSRVDPAIITDADPGDIFAIRNVANLVPPYAKDAGYHGVSAALEFAVCILKVENIVILGHSHCAGVHALRHPESLKDSDFIGPWVHIGDPAKQRLGTIANDLECQHACEREVIKLSLENLQTFPWIQDRVRDGSLTLHGWYFDIEDGVLYQHDPETGKFA